MAVNKKNIEKLAEEIMNDDCPKKQKKIKKMKKVHKEEWDDLPVKERYALLSKIIFDTKDLTNIGSEVAGLTEKISETIISESDGDWFDKHTLKRNASEITKKGHEFNKNASELKNVFERMQALYEEIGMLIERYL